MKMIEDKNIRYALGVCEHFDRIDVLQNKGIDNDDNCIIIHIDDFMELLGDLKEHQDFKKNLSTANDLLEIWK